MPRYNNLPTGPMKIEKNVYVPMRDGVRLAVDVYRPDNPGKFPALLSISPYGKEIQTLPYPFPQPAGDYTNEHKTALWDGNIEAGPTDEIVAKGYAHVIGDLRGMGDSEGEGTGDAKQEGEDGHDIVEWLAQQPWCDGNIGGIGMSYFAMTQVQTALEQPPHLKAIAPFFWHERGISRNGIIFGTPIYFWGMTAQAKAIMDRTIALNHPERNLNNKVAGVVAVCGSLGLVDALKDYSYYFIQKRMLPANQVSAYAGSPDDLRKMEQCMKALNDLGRQMVALVKMGFSYPAEFIKGPGAFGTHTR